MSTVLLTGCTGFIGSHLAELLLKNSSNTVVGTKRWRSPLDNVQHLIGEPHGIKLHDCELRDLSSIITLLSEVKPDTIYHLAAQSHIPQGYTAPADTIITNVIGTLNLFEAVRLLKLDPVIVVSSSSEVYGQVSKENIPIKETCPFQAVSPYGISKIAVDLMSYAYHKSYGLRTVIIRLFTPTGSRKGPVAFESSFARQIALIERGLQEPKVRVGNLESVRTIIDVRDAVKAYVLAAEKCSYGEAYNVGSKESMTVDAVLRKMLSMRFLQKMPEVVVCPELLRPADITLQVPDCTKFKSVTGYEPLIPFYETIADIMNYWRGKVKLMRLSDETL